MSPSVPSSSATTRSAATTSAAAVAAATLPPTKTTTTTTTNSTMADKENDSRNMAGEDTNALIALMKSVTEKRRHEECPVCFEELCPHLWKREPVKCALPEYRTYLCLRCGKSVCGTCHISILHNDSYACPCCRETAFRFENNEAYVKAVLTIAREIDRPWIEYSVGAIYYLGLHGVQKDIKRARHWLGKAYQKGWYEAGQMIAMLHYDNDEIEKSLEYLDVVIAATGEGQAIFLMTRCLRRQPNHCIQTEIQALHRCAKRHGSRSPFSGFP